MKQKNHHNLSCVWVSLHMLASVYRFKKKSVLYEFGPDSSRQTENEQ